MKMFSEYPITIETENFEMGATLTYPEDTTPCPGVVLAGGSMSHSQDGDLVMDSQSVLSRKAMHHFAHRLAQNGIASIRWDKMGFFDSRLKKNRPVENADHVSALEAAYKRLSTEYRIDPAQLVIAGESAGVYYTSLFAGTGRQASAYVLLGALASSMETLFAFNYHRTKDMNVPPGDSQRIADCLAKNGNPDYVHSQILNADHSFQHTPPLYEDRLRQRISLDCIKNEYAVDVYEQMANWINTLFSRSA